mmetsp:Transcript_8443/g.7457  ORF Transcript_8443/g.7457 Transcript_8443/m.7457 type:complete len:82 (-) Transcript_8443:16-261(-)
MSRNKSRIVGLVNMPIEYDVLEPFSTRVKEMPRPKTMGGKKMSTIYTNKYMMTKTMTEDQKGKEKDKKIIDYISNRKILRI